ncbi:hypothetical protein VCRA219O19_20366 [Vibrio crassostreae]|nr:hypothetical protein VCRA219O19_20366 [Vibrio crassostreae]
MRIILEQFVRQLGFNYQITQQLTHINNIAYKHSFYAHQANINKEA